MIIYGNWIIHTKIIENILIRTFYNKSLCLWRLELVKNFLCYVAFSDMFTYATINILIILTFMEFLDEYSEYFYVFCSQVLRYILTEINVTFVLNTNTFSIFRELNINLCYSSDSMAFTKIFGWNSRFPLFHNNSIERKSSATYDCRKTTFMASFQGWVIYPKFLCLNESLKYEFRMLKSFLLLFI